MNKYDEIYDMIYEMGDCEDINTVLDTIEDAYENEEITLKEKSMLLQHYKDESLRIPLIDDYEWELMKEFDPNLSEQ